MFILFSIRCNAVEPESAVKRLGLTAETLQTRAIGSAIQALGMPTEKGVKGTVSVMLQKCILLEVWKAIGILRFEHDERNFWNVEQTNM